MNPRRIPKGEVVLMGDELWTKVLRFVVCFLIALALMMATARKAC